MGPKDVDIFPLKNLLITTIYEVMSVSYFPTALTKHHDHDSL